MIPRGAVRALVLALAFTGGVVGGRLHAARVPDLAAFEPLIRREAESSGVPPALLLALVAAESGGDPDAVSRVGAVGLCQLMPATAAEEARRLRVPDYAPERLADPALNVRLGASYLGRLLLRMDGNQAWALAAYNAGATNARRWQRRAPDVSARDAILREGFAETRGFVTRVLRFRDAYVQ